MIITAVNDAAEEKRKQYTMNTEIGRLCGLVEKNLAYFKYLISIVFNLIMFCFKS